MRTPPARRYPSNVYNLINYASSVSTPAVCKCSLCSDPGSFSLHISGIKTMIELSGLESYRAAA